MTKNTAHLLGQLGSGFLAVVGLPGQQCVGGAGTIIDSTAIGIQSGVVDYATFQPFGSKVTVHSNIINTVGVVNDTTNVHVMTMNEISPLQRQHVVQIVPSPPLSDVVQSSTDINVQTSAIQNLDTLSGRIAICNPITSMQIDVSTPCFAHQLKLVPQLFYDKWSRQIPTTLTINQVLTFASNYPEVFVCPKDLEVSLLTSSPSSNMQQFVIVRYANTQDYVRVMPLYEYVQFFRVESGTPIVNNTIIHPSGSTFQHIHHHRRSHRGKNHSNSLRSSSNCSGFYSSSNSNIYSSGHGHRSTSYSQRPSRIHGLSHRRHRSQLDLQ